jgi:hypothetical protein
MTIRERPTLVQFGKLRRAHFDRAPVWVACHSFDHDEPWYEETTEQTFRPWGGPLPFDPALGMAVILADYQLADGTQLGGFVTPQLRDVGHTAPDLGILQPHIFGPGGRQLSFWFGIITPPETSKTHFYSRLGRTAAQVFPINFSAQPGLALGIAEGTVPGFCYIPDLKTLTFVT